MNNQAEKFHQENGKMIQQLIESLDAILTKFAQGIIPGEPEKSDAKYMLETYLEYLIKFKEMKPPAFEKVASTKNLPYDEAVALKELNGIGDSIGLLVRLGHEKMLMKNDSVFETDGGQVLIQGGYCDEIITETGRTHYYVLSEKGEKAIRSKTLLSALRKELPTAIVPQGILNESFKWSNLYVRRLEMINKYYRNMRDNTEHIIFSLDESKDMVFGCEINDSEEVVYAFAGIFDEKIDDHISQIKDIVNSGRIDRLIVINSSEEGKALLESEGLVTADYPQIKYELLK